MGHQDTRSLDTPKNLYKSETHVKSGTTDIDIDSSNYSFYTVFTVSLQLCFFTTDDTGRIDTDKKYRQIDG